MTAAEHGILPAQAIRALFQRERIIAPRSPDPDQIQPASLDLRLGPVAYRVRASFLPGAGTPVAEKLERLKLHAIDLKDGAVLETGCVYIVPLLESLALAPDISATTNPKSSTGRLDVFTRVITDGGRAFDTVPAGYNGPLYAEISPRTFPVLVREGSRLSQIRFRVGQSLVSDDALLAIHLAHGIVSGGGTTAEEDDTEAVIAGGVHLTIDLEGEGPGSLIGYRGKRHTGVIDVDAKAAQDPLDFWEPIYHRGKSELILDPNEFYILMSREAVHVPPLFAAEMVPFDPLVGEFRVHYAGFFDPGFGHAAIGGAGARAVLEVRSHEVPFIVEHGQTVGRLVYEQMLDRPDSLYGEGIGSNYQGQSLKLSKHFRAD
ncbi:MAG: 2'-deoxycytidine 5'-triphosphate deaminase [Stappia sp.]|uniref:2'-deoxycytidine 5'-triphosphate deaminase n=1 Tax=Stappia sp. TaxID=1870903 RepID=UPI000C408C23|nr:2'-deoxycytidine 5'-triphosphate deaminase [Stappia sp.]MAA97890.1 2'-deoxycytidine 5'-triphosphate deaminase [Stappia sp.]MBM19696.1 2'-deoxycytidine 5'-triphosphate deaminase [Stappia sp.]|tara:strand:+ start:173 stop:1297 length:1125 start_codon:yes stop_codon:yes gene_type:complete